MKTDCPPLGYWLLPAEPQRSYFSKLIREFAEKCDAPAFEPHVTLYATNASSDIAWPRVEAATRELSQITLRIVRIDFSEQFAKTLFVEFEHSEAASSLSRMLKTITPNPSDYAFRPHLSLIYKTMPEAEKVSLARSIRLPFSEVHFDEIQLTTCNATFANRADVESMRALQRHKFLHAGGG